MGIRLAITLNGVDLGEGKSKKTVSFTGREGTGDLLGKLDGLILDLKPTDGDDVRTDGARGSATVTILNLPGLIIVLLEGLRLLGIELLVGLLEQGRISGADLELKAC